MASIVTVLRRHDVRRPDPPRPAGDGGSRLSSVTDTVVGIAEHKAPRAWYIAFAISSSFTLLLFSCIAYLMLSRGRGVGQQQPGLLGLGRS